MFQSLAKFQIMSIILATVAFSTKNCTMVQGDNFCVYNQWEFLCLLNEAMLKLMFFFDVKAKISLIGTE